MVTTTTPPLRDAVPNIRGMDVETLNTLYPPKLEPMPEPIRQFRHFLAIGELLSRFFEAVKREVAVIGDCFIYYRNEYGGISSVAPDLCVAFDVKIDALDADNSYFLERMGKPPEFVMEIGSPSTAERDVKEKPSIYAYIGVGEYWMFDPDGGSIYGFPLMGLRLVDGEYKPMELEELPNGTVRGYSEALGLTILWENGDLHFIDPSTGRRLRRPSELEADEREAQRRAEEERRSREAAERRAESAEAELAELRRRLGKQ